MMTVKNIAICLVSSVATTLRAETRPMPTVYDRNCEFGFTMAAADFPNGDVAVAGFDGEGVQLARFDRLGNQRFTKRFSSGELTAITSVSALPNDRCLLTGRCEPAAKGRSCATGRAVVIAPDGGLERSITTGAEITSAAMLPDGGLVLAGNTLDASERRRGMVCRTDRGGRILYTYVSASGERCDRFVVRGERSEYICAAFSSEGGGETVGLDGGGKPLFVTTLSGAGFTTEQMIAPRADELYLVGEERQGGGEAVKIGRDGQIIFRRRIIPDNPSLRLDRLISCPGGELLVGGGDDSTACFALMRGDGTRLALGMEPGRVSDMAVDRATGHCFVSIYDPQAGRGKIIRLSPLGARLYEKATAVEYNALRVNPDGELLMASAASGRLSMLSPGGELLFDRYAADEGPTGFADVFLPPAGEALFIDGRGRMVKFAHGVRVNDVRVEKPLGGRASALFTVTLSGYGFSAEGSPLPVTVDYRTRPLTATEGVGFVPVAGTISFVPGGGQDTFTVEVPVNANDLLEGDRTFALELSGVVNSYPVRPTGMAVIKDQAAVVKLVETSPGVEGGAEVMFELGIFKSDGKPLINSTGADIVVDGRYGGGTADELDYDTGRRPRLAISDGRHGGRFNVAVLEDARYEAVKSVSVEFDRVHAMSTAEVSFGEAASLLCVGAILDQEAMVAIEPLGDRAFCANNTLGGMFRISLVRARDGAPQTNNSGDDIVVTVEVDSSSTARQGEHFVLTNAHDLRIPAGGRSGTVNLNGMALHSSAPGPKGVTVNITKIRARGDAGPIRVSPAKGSATVMIRNE
ncbi:MAG: hypothetical protein LBH06_01330 [Rikenellaceae bacterium]|jgi:hypothetical protein|nr:hypothetical protein [Rikenellaceae bacterium]